MFQTDVASEIQIPVGINIPGEKSWWYVKKRLHMCWFHVICEVAYDDGETLREIFFIDQIDHLCDLNNHSRFNIVEVELVSPSYMNGDQHWKMEPLSEIQEGVVHDVDNEYRMHVFILKDGRRYLDNLISETDEEKIMTTTTLFKLETG